MLPRLTLRISSQCRRYPLLPSKRTIVTTVSDDLNVKKPVSEDWTYFNEAVERRAKTIAGQELPVREAQVTPEPPAPEPIYALEPSPTAQLHLSTTLHCGGWQVCSAWYRWRSSRPAILPTSGSWPHGSAGSPRVDWSPRTSRTHWSSRSGRTARINGFGIAPPSRFRHYHQTRRKNPRNRRWKASPNSLPLKWMDMMW